MDKQEAPAKARRLVAKRSVRPRREQAPKKELAPQKLKLLITVVPRSKGEFYTDLLQSFEVNLQFAATGSGTAGSDILRMMGLETTDKRVIFSLIREDRAAEALAVLEEKFKTIRGGKGIAMTVPMTGMIGVSAYQFLCNHRTVREESST